MGAVDPETYQPPLSWWGHTWRLLLMLLMSGALVAQTVVAGWHQPRWHLYLDVALGVVCFVAVMFRRRYPVAVTTLTNLASIVSAASSFGPWALSMVSLSTRRRWREIVPQVILAAVCSYLGDEFIYVADNQEPQPVRLATVGVLIAALVAWGLYIGSRRELIASWQSRALLAEAEQEAEVARARSVERARIAREMHDVLAHRISTVSMQAGALAYRDNLPADEVRSTARTIEETSRLAMTELREVLGVLRDGPGDAAPESPQFVGGGGLDALIDESRNGGMRITFSCTADLTTLSAARHRTLYRCVQEALTNARKHAAGVPVIVSVTGDPASGVDLTVSNSRPLRDSVIAPPRSGLGLVGIAERVELAGGRHSAGTTHDGHFVLHVWLPWQS